jgi:hypothetical protein
LRLFIFDTDFNQINAIIWCSVFHCQITPKKDAIFKESSLLWVQSLYFNVYGVDEWLSIWLGYMKPNWRFKLVVSKVQNLINLAFKIDSGESGWYSQKTLATFCDQFYSWVPYCEDQFLVLQFFWISCILSLFVSVSEDIFWVPTLTFVTI